jgi:uncharacterized protein YPO0396
MVCRFFIVSLLYYCNRLDCLLLLQLLKLRQAKNELERKVQDQEEELDEQAGTIQQLEQVTETAVTASWLRFSELLNHAFGSDSHIAFFSSICRPSNSVLM